MDTVLLRDALHCTSKRSGANVTYAQGIVVGVTSALVSCGYTFPAAFRLVARNMPYDHLDGIYPPRWKEVL